MNIYFSTLLLFLSISASAATVSLNDVLSNLTDTLTVEPVEYQGLKVVDSWQYYDQQATNLSSAEAICNLAGYKFVASVETTDWITTKEKLATLVNRGSSRLFEQQFKANFSVKLLSKVVCKR